MTMSNGVRVVVKVVARTEAIAEITAIVLKLAAQSRKETGCVSYEVLKDMSNAEIFVLVEEWSSLAALDAHNKTAHFHEAVSNSQPFLAKPLEVGRYAAIG
jgi:quinol monooxygenase YgiN